MCDDGALLSRHQRRCSYCCSVAVANQLWGVALLLSRLLGEAATTATAAAMAQQCVAEVAPLQTLLLLLGGTAADQPLSVAAAGAAEQGALASASSAAASTWQPGVFNPAAAATALAPATGSAAGWRQHLAMLAANRTPGDEAAMLLLGRQLLSAGQLLPAHACFVLAGALLQPWDLAAAAALAATAAGSAVSGNGGAGSDPPLLVLLGADAVAAPRSCAQLDSILATEVFTWSRTVGKPCRQRRAWLATCPAACLPVCLLAPPTSCNMCGPV